MTEKQKLEHRRKHKDNTIDYIKTYDLNLTNSELKGVGELQYAQGITLSQVILSFGNEIKELKAKVVKLEEKNIELENKLEQVEKINKEIIKGKLKL
jgi:hypothetical protein